MRAGSSRKVFCAKWKKNKERAYLCLYLGLDSGMAGLVGGREFPAGTGHQQVGDLVTLLLLAGEFRMWTLHGREEGGGAACQEQGLSSINIGSD
jgi:hypothetical protein